MNCRIAGLSAAFGVGLVIAGCGAVREEAAEGTNPAPSPPIVAVASRPMEVQIPASKPDDSAAATRETVDDSKTGARLKEPTLARGTSLPAISGKGILPAVALINGKEVNGDGFIDILRAVAGRRVFDQLVDLVLVRLECNRMEIEMNSQTDATRVQAELDRLLEDIKGSNKEEKSRVLGTMLKDKGISPVEWRMEIELNADLGALLGKPAAVGMDRTADAEALLGRLQKKALIVIANPTLAEQYPEQGNENKALAPAKFGMRRPTDAEIDGALGPGDLAFINGRAVKRQTYDTILIEVAGMRVFQQIYDLTLVRNECVIMGLPADATDRMHKEMDRALNSVSAMEALGKDADSSQRQQALAAVLAERKVSLVEFQMGIETSADLRALAQGKIAVNDGEIESAYRAQYGERRMVHILALPNDEGAAIEMARKYKELIATGIKTEDAASQLKQTPPANWTISKNAMELPEIRAVAFEKLKKLGDLSDVTPMIREGKPAVKVLVLLDRILEDRTDRYPLTEALREDLRTKILAAKEQAWMNNQLQTLRKNAVVNIKDPTLKSQYDEANTVLKKSAAEKGS